MNQHLVELGKQRVTPQSEECKHLLPTMNWRTRQNIGKAQTAIDHPHLINTGELHTPQVQNVHAVGVHLAHSPSQTTHCP